MKALNMARFLAVFLGLFCLPELALATRMDPDSAFVIGSAVTANGKGARILTYHDVPVNSGYRLTGVEIRGDKVFIVNNGRKVVKDGEVVAEIGDLGHGRTPGLQLTPVSRDSAPPELERGRKLLFFAKNREDREGGLLKLKAPKIGKFLGKILPFGKGDESIAA